ncbi:MAG: rhomboid family intramembrane serine protease [Myxococcales bacterium]
MRQLREVPDERTGRMLVDALDDAGIESELKVGGAGSSVVWVLDETQLPRAKELTAGWLDAGEIGENFQRASARGRGARELKERTDQRRREQAEAASREFEALTKPRPTPLTWGLIALCVGIAILGQVGDHRQVFAALGMTDPREPIHVTVFTAFGQRIEWLALPWREPWRMITPILVHVTGWHILFNMLWLRDLGRLVEARHGARYLLAFVLVSGVLSNIAQYQLGQGVAFAGMSGVVYGLLGLIWIRGRLDPNAGYGLSRFTVQFMLIWLVVGFIGDLRMANWCHLFGLLIGAAWGFISAQPARR